jgi:hypothetical protein
MTDDPHAVISDVAAFVMKNGALAEELVFGETELPGLTVAERKAVQRVEEHLQATWLAILVGSRDAVWSLVGGRSKLGRTLRKNKRRDATIWKERSVSMPLVADSAWRATCGVALTVWAPNPQYALRTWVWTQASYRDVARDATRGIAKTHINSNGTLQWFDLGTPEEGERIDELAQKAARAMWTLAEPIGQAVAQARARG